MSIWEFDEYSLDELYALLDNAEALESNGIGQDEDMMYELRAEIIKKESE